MDWGTLAGTALGAFVGVATTLLAERARWRREHSSREQAVKRELYAQYLGALSLTTHQLRDLRRDPSLTQESRVRQAGEVLGGSTAYHLRYQVLITAPDALGELADRAFGCIRTLRDHLDHPDAHSNQEWDVALADLTETLRSLRTAMRNDLITS
ncbi:hypothetical protein [Streptomyces bullii]|uniref:Protein kilB n=1 Tax=Streptomyces bullii TaxID=349910 RepID=A0ABW0US93_9ACTN